MPSAVLNISPEHIKGTLHKRGSISGVLTGKTKRIRGTIIKDASVTYYDGPYVVDPSAHGEIVLHTDGKAMANNVTVNKIYYAEVSNPADGMTAYIADH